MAAIDLTKLDQQIRELLESAEDPLVFQRKFHSILEFYHRYSHRKQKDAMPISFMRHYELPGKVLPYIQGQLRPLAHTDPENALKIVQQLWQDDYFEARDTAASLLGQIPVDYNEKVLGLIVQWINMPLDQAVVESVFTKTNKTILEKAPQEWKNLIEKLLHGKGIQEKRMGLNALARLIPTSPSDDLPEIFSWVRTFLTDPDQTLDANLRSVVAALTNRSSNETAYLLREVLADSSDLHVGRRTRHYLEFFDEPAQKRLLDAIKRQVILPE